MQFEVVILYSIYVQYSGVYEEISDQYVQRSMRICTSGMYSLKEWSITCHNDYYVHTKLLMNNQWWCLVIEEQSYFSDCVWWCVQGCTWAVCGSDIYTWMIWQWFECRWYQQHIQNLVFDRSTYSTISFLSGWQDGAKKGGRSLLPVEAGKLGSGNFLQVVTCKSGGRSLLPVEAGKLKSL